MNLYEMLKARKVGWSNDFLTNIYAKSFGGSQPASEHEYTGAVPYTFTADGTPLLDWYIKGNTIQNGTPSPSNPVMPNGVGERTGNLLNPSDILPNTMFNVNANPPAFVYSDTFDCSNYISVTSDTYLRTLNNVAVGNYFFEFDANKNFLRQRSPGEGIPMVISSDASYIVFNIPKTFDITKYMFSRTSTPLPYEPYGYKIPISSANTTTPVYLGEMDTKRKIGKYVFTGNENWYDVSTNGVYYTNVVKDLANKNNYTPKCSHFKLIQQTTIANLTDGSFTSDNNVFFWFKESSITSLADWKAYLAQQYANGTPVCVWYVLATPQTAVVNEPLRKIGDYADTLTATQSGVSIPTNNGSNTFDVDTTLKPSEVYIKYMG